MIFKAGRGRKAALISTVLGLAVLALAVFSLRDRIREEWWIHRLGSKDPETRLSAAERLACLNSKRAKAPLFQLLREKGQEEWRRFGPEAVGFLTEALEEQDPRVLGASANILLLIGPPARSALPALRKLLQDPTKNNAIRDVADQAIESIEGPTPGPLVSIETPSLECEVGKEAAIEFRATIKKLVRVFLIQFDIPNAPVKLIRGDAQGTASGAAPERAVACDPSFVKGGFLVGVNQMDVESQWIGPGEHLLLIKAIIRFAADAKPGDYPVQIKSADFAGFRGSLNSSLVLPADGVIHLKPATGPPPPEPAPDPKAVAPAVAVMAPAAGGATASTGEFVFWAEDVFADPGAEKVAVRIFATSTEEAQAFSFALRVDPKLGKLRKVGIEKTASEAAEIDQFLYQKHAVAKGETSAGFLFDTVPPYGHLFPPGTNQHVATILVDVHDGTASGSTIPVQLGSFGDPPGSNVFAVKGQSRSALTHSGNIFVGQSPVPPPIELAAKVEKVGEKSAVVLTWKTASSCDSIRIERDWKTLKVVDGDMTSFRDEAPGPGEHRYRVFARKSNKESFPSAVITEK